MRNWLDARCCEVGEANDSWRLLTCWPPTLVIKRAGLDMADSGDHTVGLLSGGGLAIWIFFVCLSWPCSWPRTLGCGTRGCVWEGWEQSGQRGQARLAAGVQPQRELLV